MDNRLNCCKFSFTYKQCGSLDTGCIHLHMCTLVHSQLFIWDSCYWIFSFICMFCRLFFAILYFFFWPLCCLSFFDVRLIITPLVSSNRSYHPPRPQRVSFVFISCLTSSLSYFQRGCNPQWKDGVIFIICVVLQSATTMPYVTAHRKIVCRRRV